MAEELAPSSPSEEEELSFHGEGRQLRKAGHREGASAGQEAGMQAGFDEGFGPGARVGFLVGQLRGRLNAAVWAQERAGNLGQGQGQVEVDPRLQELAERCDKRNPRLLGAETVLQGVEALPGAFLVEPRAQADLLLGHGNVVEPAGLHSASLSSSSSSSSPPGGEEE